MKRTMVIAVLLGMFLSMGTVGCGPTETPVAVEVTDEVQPTAALLPASPTPGSIYGEAPMLAEWVAAGELPPVEERLPVNPVVVQPVERVGVYGGTWRMGILESGGDSAFMRTINYENLVKWDPAWTKVVPNVAESWEVNENSTEFTFHLREGLRWSDGEPFTSADIMFTYEVISHPDYWTFPWFYESGGEPMVVEAPDDYTVVFKFKEPYGMFLQQLATGKTAALTSQARHYLQEYFIGTNPNADELARQLGFESWRPMYGVKAAPWWNPEAPKLDAWIFETIYTGTLEEWISETIYTESDETMVATRNPYYWKIDPDFNQLPYLDRVVFSVEEDVDSIVDLALAGEIDMQYRHIAGREDRQRFEDNQAAGDYGFFTTIPSLSNTTAMYLNQTHSNPIIRELLQNRDVRAGLSHAIDRERIIADVYLGHGNPFQVGPLPESPYYNEQLGTQYLAYDPDLANEMIDRTGYITRDNEGFRLGPDGKRLSFTVVLADLFGFDWSAVMQIVKQNWQAVGVELMVEEMSRDEMTTVVQELDSEISIWVGFGGLDIAFNDGAWLPIKNSLHVNPRWRLWFIDPDDPEAMEPPNDVKQQMELWERFNTTGDAAEQHRYMSDMLAISADRFDFIGISTIGVSYGIVKNNFHNVPEVIPDSWSYPSPAPTNPCQYFIDPQE